jgi:predicted ester cyclase
MCSKAALLGHDNVRVYLDVALRAVPDLRIEMREKWVSPGGLVIASSFDFCATFSGPLSYPGFASLAPTGRTVAISGIDRSEIRDGRLARHQIFWDGSDFGRQVGLLPARNSRMEIGFPSPAPRRPQDVPQERAAPNDDPAPTNA